MSSPQAAVDLLDFMKAATGGAVAAFELMPKFGLDLVCRHVPGARNPLESTPDWSVLIEITSGEAERASQILERALAEAFENELVSDAVIAQSDAQSHEFWMLRENIPEGEKAHGKASKHDVSVAVSKMPAFMDAASKMAEAFDPSIRVIAFGHVGDGNVHFNVGAADPGADDSFLKKIKPVTSAIYDLVDQYDGSISAEHGIGILKQDEFASRKPADIAIMRAIKSAIDPNGIMNPRVLLPAK